MKYLLTAINAKYIHPGPAVYLLRESVDPRWRSQVGIGEYTINEYPAQILAGIYREKPDLLAISCYIWNAGHVRWLLRELKKVLPDLQLWLGGPEAACQSRAVLEQFPAVDGIMTGEGELTFPALVREYELARRQDRDPDLSQIPGIICRKTSLKIQTAGMKKKASDSGDSVSRDSEPKDLASKSDYIETPPAIVTDLDTLPFIYQDLQPFENRILYYESSRGCPFSCSYCLSASEKGVRFRSLPLVFEELQFFLDRQVRQVKFLDRSFNCNEARTLGIWEYLRDHDNGVTNFHFELEPELLTERELELLTSLRPGQVKVEIGVQTANARTLQAIRRRESTAHLAECAGKLLDAGNVHVHLDLIAGLPFEDYQSFRHSFNTVYAMHPHELQLGFLKLLHGTPLREEAETYGIRCLSRAPHEVLATNWLSYAEILRLKRIEEVLEIYYNSGQFSRTMRVLEQCFPDPFSMYEALADYYDRRGLFVQTPSRIRRYEILLDFIKETLAEASEAKEGTESFDIFCQLLTFDVYLRESVKRRPAFAPGRAPVKRNDRYHEELFTVPVHEIRPYGSHPLPASLILRETFCEGAEALNRHKGLHQALQPLASPDPARAARIYRVSFTYDHRNPVTRDARTDLVDTSLSALSFTPKSSWTDLRESWSRPE